MMLPEAETCKDKYDENWSKTDMRWALSRSCSNLTAKETICGYEALLHFA